ncbi:conserved protein of unknown function [Burkholderia multivorans]
MTRHLPEPTPAELIGLIDAAVRAVSLPAALAILGVHRTTLMRWRTGQTRIPPAALALLRVWSEGKLPGMSDDWRDWRFDGDRLVAPNGQRFAPRDMLAWHWKEQALDAHQRRIKQLETIVYDQARRLQLMGGAANDHADDPTHPPPRRAVT